MFVSFASLDCRKTSNGVRLLSIGVVAIVYALVGEIIEVDLRLADPNQSGHQNKQN